ncbi:MAG: signal transduction histidine kinase regulating citrate/malate metabolism [Actinomycetia bacterium]|nr:signal transduction histidine kinase regulating citrate/malate metabolism [Actinomycetes bacterium]
MSSRRHAPRLSTQIVLLQLALILLTVGAGLAVSLVEARRQFDRSAGNESLAIARSVAGIPAIRRAFVSRYPPRQIQPIAERIRKLTGASFIVVANRQGVRYSHPNPALIGQRLTDGAIPLSGRTWVGVEDGSLGRSMRAKVPLLDDFGDVIGFVSVGVLEKTLSARLRSDLPVILIPPLFGLLLGAAGSVLLARRIKRQTFGLEPDEIAALLEQREAMLHGVREGAITVDASGRITLLNDEAQRLLGLDASALGEHLADVVPAGRVRDVLIGRVEGADQVVVVDDRVLVTNRMPVEVRGRPIGAVVTLRDRTELEGLLRELDDVRSLADALRAQEHEFSHRLHVIGGLIELDRNDDAVHFINSSSLLHQKLAASLVDRVGDPILVALLLGKASVASERGIDLEVSALTKLPEDLGDVRGLVTVLGNLIDNALESVAAGSDSGGRVEITLSIEDDDLVIKVHDSGPGVDPTLAAEIFRDGYTTKVANGPAGRGLGLALVSQAVRRRGGSISVRNEEGALFTVTVPLRGRVRPEAGALVAT